MFEGVLDMDQDGYLITEKNVCHDQVPGVFCLRRRAGPPLSPGDYRRGHRLRGGLGGGEVSGRTRKVKTFGKRVIW